MQDIRCIWCGAIVDYGDPAAHPETVLCDECAEWPVNKVIDDQVDEYAIAAHEEAA